MPRQLVIDSSTLFAFDMAGMAGLLRKLKLSLLVPPSVLAEIKAGDAGVLLGAVKAVPLKGRTIKKSHALENLGIGRGEADCCALAAKLKLDFIVCDDRKFVRQRFFSSDKTLKAVKVVGFSFLLHVLFRERGISDVWPFFEKIIGSNNWRRSEVEAANYAFLKEMGY